MAKSIKQINGLKIIKRYSVGAMMSALFCFVIVAAVVLPFFLPFLSVRDTSGTISHNGKTLILALFNHPYKEFDLMITSVSSLIFFVSTSIFLVFSTPKTFSFSIIFTPSLWARDLAVILRSACLVTCFPSSFL